MKKNFKLMHKKKGIDSQLPHLKYFLAIIRVPFNSTSPDIQFRPHYSLLQHVKMPNFGLLPTKTLKYEKTPYYHPTLHTYNRKPYKNGSR